MSRRTRCGDCGELRTGVKRKRCPECTAIAARRKEGRNDDWIASYRRGWRKEAKP